MPQSILKLKKTVSWSLTPREKFTGLLISFTGKLLGEAADSFAALNQALKRRAEAR